MIANLKDYVPSEIEVILPDEVKETFPNTIFEGESIDDVLSTFGEKFVCTFPTKMDVERKMDSFEIKETREEYCIFTENDLPQAEVELLDAIEDAKRIKKDAEEKLESVRKRIAELAYKVKTGKESFKLPVKGTVQFCLAGYRLTYSFINGRMQLMQGDRLSPKDRTELWSQEGKNRESFNELFGTDYPEVERPEDAVPQNLEEAFDDAYNIKNNNLPFENN